MGASLREDETMFRFGNFELSPSRRLLTRDGRAVKIGSRALDLLVTLVESAGQVVTKDRLISSVWMNVIVEDTNLRVHISCLRKLLGDDGNENRYIVHVARRGYVFVAPWRRAPSSPAATSNSPTRGQGHTGQNPPLDGGERVMIAR
jgi:DNA-binding winged helix-turn-helix (wHTH) protein